MTLQTQPLTYEEYLEGLETRDRYEIVDGVMIMAPAPTLDHQKILRQLFRVLDAIVTRDQLGEVLFAPLDILVQREPLRTRQPDLLFVSRERADILGHTLEGAPDMVSEILSPGNSRAGVESKLADYASMGVRECWLLSPEARSVEVLELVDRGWVRIALCGLGDRAQSRVFPGLSLPVAELFE